MADTTVGRSRIGQAQFSNCNGSSCLTEETSFRFVSETFRVVLYFSKNSINLKTSNLKVTGKPHGFEGNTVYMNNFAEAGASWFLSQL